MKRGLMTVEALFLIIFTAMLGATVFSVFQFILYRNSPANDRSSPQFAYQNLFLQLQQDVRLSHTVEKHDGVLELYGKDERKIIYTIASHSISRIDKSGYQHVLVRSVASGGWSIAAPPRRMFSLWLVPQQKMGHPFFTSFALRGVVP